MRQAAVNGPDVPLPLCAISDAKRWALDLPSVAHERNTARSRECRGLLVELPEIDSAVVCAVKLDGVELV